MRFRLLAEAVWPSAACAGGACSAGGAAPVGQEDRLLLPGGARAEGVGQSTQDAFRRDARALVGRRP